MQSTVDLLTNIVCGLTVVVGLLLIADLLWAFFTLGELFKLEFNQHPDQWQKDGKPWGFFWNAPSSAYSSWSERSIGSLHAELLAIGWLFHAPQWMRSNQKGRQLVRRLRILVAIWNFSLLAVMGLIAFAATHSQS